jgi:condensin complex subunit 1
VNEKSVKCLTDNFKLYKDALFDEEVKKSFFSIVARAKKFAKAELKQVLEEWETKLNEQAELGAENELAGEKAARARARASKTALKRKNARNCIEAIQWSEGEEQEEETESDGDDTEVDKENTPAPPQRTPEKARSARRGGRRAAAPSTPS